MAADKMIGEINATEYSMYTFYRKYDKIPKKYKVEGYRELRKVIVNILKIIRKNFVNRKAGVAIKNFAYFFVWKAPRKNSYLDEHNNESYNYHTNGHNYYLVMMPYNKFRGWQMDWKFTSGRGGITRDISHKIKSGYEYKAYPHSLRKI